MFCFLVWLILLSFELVCFVTLLFCFSQFGCLLGLLFAVFSVVTCFVGLFLISWLWVACVDFGLL